MSVCHSSQQLGELGPIAITRADAWRVAIPMHEPFRISSGEVSLKEAVLVRLNDGDSFGWGESSAMPGAFYSNETPDTCEKELIEQILPQLAGQTFPNMLALEAWLDQTTSSRFVRVAIETAAWELLARKAGKSLHQLFGIAERPIPSGLAVGLYDTESALHAALERYRVRDYRRLKIKIKRGHDLDLVAAVRRWYGDIPLFVDANADYSLADLEVFRKMDAFKLMMLEQPLAKLDFEGSAALQRAVQTPVCCDESIETKEDVVRAVDEAACRIVNIKLQRIGGFLEAIRIIEYCQQHGMALWMGTMPELGIGSAQALVLAAHPACVYPTDVEPSERWYHDDILFPAMQLRNGELTVPPGPGLGFTVDMGQVQRYALRQWSF